MQPTTLAAPSLVVRSRSSSEAFITSSDRDTTVVMCGVNTGTGVCANSLKQSKNCLRTLSSLAKAAWRATATIGGTRSRKRSASSSVERVCTNAQHALRAATATGRSWSCKAVWNKPASLGSSGASAVATVSDSCTSKMYASSRWFQSACVAHCEMNWRSSGHLLEGSNILARADAKAATDFRTALSGSDANLSSNRPLVLSRAFFLTFFQSLPIFLRKITAAIWRTAGFSERDTCVVNSPTDSGRFSTGFRASSACLMRVVSGAVKAASISPSCWSFCPRATAMTRFGIAPLAATFLRLAGSRRRLSSRRVEVLLLSL
mmetsp:Transcript_4144/g.11847  ORF Transcript_4144/g.11847 Transcript_4144/m.11847 type:complete len:319 (-) Transcript_4144:142-1098(-)